MPPTLSGIDEIVYHILAHFRSPFQDTLYLFATIIVDIIGYHL